MPTVKGAVDKVLTALSSAAFATVKAVSLLALGYVALLAIYIAYSLYREPIANAEARDFCASVKVGSPADGLVERALAAGAPAAHTKWRDGGEGKRSLHVIFTGAPPFSRHTCSITATSTRVVEAHYYHLD
jgi:hypothetical protein